MKALLFGTAKSVAEGIGSDILNKGCNKLTDYFSEQALQKADEKLRDYLKERLPEYDYEIIDKFIAEQNLYIHDQATTNWSIMANQTEQIISDFYAKYPLLKNEHAELTPLIRQTIIATYDSVLSHLSKEGRILYQQALIHQEQNSSAQKKQQETLDDIKRLLISQKTQKLSYTDILKINNTLSNVIHEGYFSTAEALIPIIEEQIDDRDRFFCTSLKILLKGYTGTHHEVDDLCIQFSRENPSQNAVESIVTFLLQMEIKSAIIILIPIIAAPLSALINGYMSDKPQDEVAAIAKGDGNIKDEYVTYEPALWIYATHAKKYANRKKALETYKKLEALHSSIWLSWAIAEIQSQQIFTDCISNANRNIINLQSHLECMLHFANVFEKLSDNLCSEYIDTFLTCAKLLPFDDFVSFYSLLSERMREMSIAQRHWYSAQLANEICIDEPQLHVFCEKTGDDNLWSAYLLHKSTADPEYVLKSIEMKKEVLEKEIAAVMAYYNALENTIGQASAFEAISTLPIPKTLTIAFNVFLARICIDLSNNNETKHIQAAVEEALNPSYRITVYELNDLINLLDNRNLWQEASNILEKYQNRDPAFMFLRLRVLISHDDQISICSTLLAQLESEYHGNAFFLYCKGIIAEHELTGSGMEYFDEAFHKQPCPQFAYYVLTSRYKRNVFFDDDVLSYATNHNNINLLYASGATYRKYGYNSKSYVSLLQGLINCGSEYHQGLYTAFIEGQFSDEQHERPPTKIIPGSCCILKNLKQEQIRKIWVHDDRIKLSSCGTSFAGYEHISPNDKTSFLLLELRIGDQVSLDGEEYEVVAINHEDIVAGRHCMQHLIDHGVIKQIQIKTDHLDEFFEEVRKMGEGRSEHIQNTIKNYRTLEPGLTLELFSEALGHPYYKVVNTLIQDRSVPFWAGIDSVEIKQDCILTPSILGILSALGIHPPENKSFPYNFYITNALKTELELASREHRNDHTAAVLCFDGNDHPYMIENTPEKKRVINQYYSRLNEWAQWAEVLDPVLPKEYPTELQSIVNAIGIPNIEAIVWAKKKNCLICCDDLFLRKLFKYMNFDSPKTIDTLIGLNYPLGLIVKSVITLIDYAYLSPISLELLQWVSNCFFQANDEDELAQYSILGTDLVEKILSNTNSSNMFLYTYQQILVQNITLHPTMKWIITKLLARHLSLSDSKNEPSFSE